MKKVIILCATVVLMSFLVWALYFKLVWTFEVVPRRLTVIEDGRVGFRMRVRGNASVQPRFLIYSSPKNGVLEGEGPTFTYCPRRDFFGEDEFVVAVKEGDTLRKRVNVEIRITSENDPPVAFSGTVVGEEDKAVAVNLIGKDVDDKRLVYMVTTPPNHGDLLGKAPYLEYYPRKNYYGEDRLIFYVSDGRLKSEPAEVKLTITPINDSPVALGQRVILYKNSRKTIRLRAVDSDNDDLSFEIVNYPSHGKLVKAKYGYTYIPDNGFIGKDELRFRANDSLRRSVPATVDIRVKKTIGRTSLLKMLKRQVKRGGIVIGNYKKPDVLFRKKRYIPASILKIAVAAAALSILGERYRFSMEIAMDLHHNLYIKGFGDPSMTSDEWCRVAEKLNARGVFKNPIKNLLLDDSFFSEELDFDGKRNDIHYFNASPGALVSNYNTITVKINGDRSITVLDKHTPLTGGVKRRARGLPVGIQHFNVATNTEQSVMYTGELVKKIFVGYGAIFTGNVERGVLPKTVGKKLRYHSKPILTRVVRKMLRDSNNFIANQLLLAIVPKGQRRKISIGDGVRALSTFLINSVGLRADDFSIVEGSGLSKKNRIDVVAMLKILEFFRPHMDLLPALSTSRYGDLSRIGRKCDIRAKSGTLRDVSTLAGFIKMRDSSWKPFVIMLEDSKRSRGRAMETIYDYYRERHAIYCQ